jgi:hypothetical protein
VRSLAWIGGAWREINNELVTWDGWTWVMVNEQTVHLKKWVRDKICRQRHHHDVWQPRIYHKFEVPVMHSTTIPESLLWYT